MTPALASAPTATDRRRKHRRLLRPLDLRRGLERPADADRHQPSALTNSANAYFAFSGTDPGGSGVASFQCRRDSSNEADWTACSSPQAYSSLADGAHTFEVRAVDQAGNADPSAASFEWSIDTTAPQTQIDSSPAALTNSANASFAFSGSDVGGSGVASFQCRRDSSNEADWTACSSPQSYSSLSDGAHTFEVRAVDQAGNTDPSAASFEWSIDTTAPRHHDRLQPSCPHQQRQRLLRLLRQRHRRLRRRLLPMPPRLQRSRRLDRLQLAAELQLPRRRRPHLRSPRPRPGRQHRPQRRQLRMEHRHHRSQHHDRLQPAALTNSANASFAFSGSDAGGSGVASFQCRRDSTEAADWTGLQLAAELQRPSPTAPTPSKSAPSTRPATPTRAPPASNGRIDTAAPPAPQLERHDSRLAGQRQQPEGRRLRPAAGSTVRLYSGADCSDSPIATVTPAELEAGVEVTVPDDSSTTYPRDRHHRCRTTPPAAQNRSPTSRTRARRRPRSTPAQRADQQRQRQLQLLRHRRRRLRRRLLPVPPRLQQPSRLDGLQLAAELQLPRRRRPHLRSPRPRPGRQHRPQCRQLRMEHRHHRAADPDRLQPSGADQQRQRQLRLLRQRRRRLRRRLLPMPPRLHRSRRLDQPAARRRATAPSRRRPHLRSAGRRPGRQRRPQRRQLRMERRHHRAADPDRLQPARPRPTAPTPTSPSPAATPAAPASPPSSAAATHRRPAPGPLQPRRRAYTSLADGAHSFEVRAIDQAGNTDPSAGNFDWTVDTTAPQTQIDTHPAALTNSANANFSFSGSDTGGSGVASFQCRRDSSEAADWTACSSPQSYSSLADGAHNFEVRALDQAGNADPSAASFEWTVDTAAPPAPQLTATIPASPANDNSPKVVGSAPAGSTVRLYASADCSGSPIATVTPAELEAGVEVTVPDDSTTIFSATAATAAENTSGCSEPLTYVEDSSAPADPDRHQPSSAYDRHRRQLHLLGLRHGRLRSRLLRMPPRLQQLGRLGHL